MKNKGIPGAEPLYYVAALRKSTYQSDGGRGTWAPSRGVGSQPASTWPRPRAEGWALRLTLCYREERAHAQGQGPALRLLNSSSLHLPHRAIPTARGQPIWRNQRLSCWRHPALLGFLLIAVGRGWRSRYGGGDFRGGGGTLAAGQVEIRRCEREEAAWD